MNELYESLLERIQQDAVLDGLADFRLAREEFHKLTGEYDEGEPWFEVRMQMFMDWYLLERTGLDGLTPVERFLKINHNNLTPDERSSFLALTTTLRSVFRIVRISGNQVLFGDVAGGGEWLVQWTLPSVGLKKDDIINTRLVLIKDTIIAGRSSVFHPVKAHEKLFEIVERAQKERMPRTHLVNYFDKVKLKLDRYSNVKIKHVYKYPTEAVF